MIVEDANYIPSGSESDVGDTNGDDDIGDEDIGEIIVADSENSEDDLPLSTFPHANKVQGGNVTWAICNISCVKPPSDFQSPFGLADEVEGLNSSSCTPYKQFNLLITDETLENMTFQTNLYAEQKDKRTVHLLSNFHDPQSTAKVKRRDRDGSSKQIPCTNALVEYNKNMNCVDRFDQLKSTYEIDRKSKKWGMRILWHFIDCCVVNSYILYKLKKLPPLTLKNFRRRVIDGLLAEKLVELQN
ncbi:hypothetical protein NQ314_000281 [Rhamnusium bicolor]|uniref:PiggyBac transposable element-derived protein domain-containing protein n=1 Tax=Rhamnusium bicolor TaxID=1586634 RepID=A0AAV8ZXS1_9CUCU|nr:hypothetical protein NQ314_000281 [Rhamnusium bicolor]